MTALPYRSCPINSFQGPNPFKQSSFVKGEIVSLTWEEKTSMTVTGIKILAARKGFKGQSTMVSTIKTGRNLFPLAGTQYYWDLGKSRTVGWSWLYIVNGFDCAMFAARESVARLQLSCLPGQVPALLCLHLQFYPAIFSFWWFDGCQRVSELDGKVQARKHTFRAFREGELH